VSGRWGVGKSSMIKLIRKSLAGRTKSEESKFVFVEFNAWLYQGYDDARAALMDVIASALTREAEQRKTGIDKTKELLSRVSNRCCDHLLFHYGRTQEVRSKKRPTGCWAK